MILRFRVRWNNPVIAPILVREGRVQARTNRSALHNILRRTEHVAILNREGFRVYQLHVVVVQRHSPEQGVAALSIHHKDQLLVHPLLVHFANRILKLTSENNVLGERNHSRSAILKYGDVYRVDKRRSEYTLSRIRVAHQNVEDTI